MTLTVRRSIVAPVLVAVASAMAISTSSLMASAVPNFQPVVPTPPAGSIGVRLLDIPVSESNNPRARNYIIDQLAPGTTIQRRIEIDNTTDSALSVSVYSDAATIKGGAFVGAADNTVNELSSWSTVKQSSLQIPGHGTAIDTVTIAIPIDATSLERYAVIWTAVNSPNGGAIDIVNRVGIREYLSVSGNNEPANASFTVDTMTAQRDSTGRAELAAQVHNTGQRAIDLSGSLTMSEISGSLQAGPFPIQLGTTLAPGQSEAVTVVMNNQIPDGPWNAVMALHSGLLVESFQAQVSFPRAAGASAAPSAAHLKATKKNHWTPVIFAAMATTILVMGTLLLLARRRHRGLEAHSSQLARPIPSSARKSTR